MPMAQTPAHDLGERIRDARLKRGMTQEALALSLRVGSIAVSRWERGVQKPRPEHLRKLARILAVPVAELAAPDDQVA